MRPSGTALHCCPSVEALHLVKAFSTFFAIKAVADSTPGPPASVPYFAFPAADASLRPCLLCRYTYARSYKAYADVVGPELEELREGWDDEEGRRRRRLQVVEVPEVAVDVEGKRAKKRKGKKAGMRTAVHSPPPAQPPYEEAASYQGDDAFDTLMQFLHSKLLRP